MSEVLKQTESVFGENPETNYLLWKVEDYGDRESLRRIFNSFLTVPSLRDLGERLLRRNT